MKLLFLLISFVTLGVLSASAQQSTKYKLFPDFDKDIQRVSPPTTANARKAAPADAGKRGKERLFENYKPQSTGTPKPKQARQASAQLPSSSSAAEAKQKLDANKTQTPQPVTPDLQGTLPEKAAQPAKTTTPPAAPKLNTQPVKKTSGQ